jgi:hypothetical protein
VTSTRWFRRFAFAYGPAFAVLYVVALKRDVALFTAFPTLGIVVWGTQHAQDAAPAMGLPAIYWYGWTATAALGALIVATAAAFVPERCARRIWSGWTWLVPALAISACVYHTLPWFRL